MVSKAVIKAALRKYDEQKGIWRRLFGDAPAIKSLRKLDPHKVDELQVLRCFIENMPKESQASYNVCKDIFSFKEDFKKVTNCLKILQQSHLLTKKNFDALKERQNPFSLIQGLFVLQEATLLTQENFDALKEHQNPFALLQALIVLKEATLLTQENFDAFKEHQNPSDLARTLPKLQDANFLTQENFTQLLDPNINVLLTFRIGENLIWDYLPNHLLTQEIFDEFIRRTSLPNPRCQIQQYINLLLGNNGAGINNNQSTHTASIHHSVSTSAIKLWDRYGAQLSENKVKEIITKIKEEIQNLSDTRVNKAAKNCIERISQSNFFDPDSQVSIKQLLALSYKARHDDAKRQGSLEDANKLFMDGLYEIQRGYNISASNVDDEQEKDQTICTAGTFNKLIEKLVGVHPDVELLFITKEVATQKLPIIVREEVNHYLEMLSKPETKEGFHYLIKLREQLSKDGIEIIWDKIKLKVADRLFDEFKSIYNNDKKNSDFLGLVEAGQYTQIVNLGDYRQQIVSSPGYREYCSQILKYSAKLGPLFFSQPRDVKERAQNTKSVMNLR